MARQTFESNGWIPEEGGSAVLKRVNAVSAVEAVARKEPMSTDTKLIPRSGDVSIDIVAKGAAYGEDAGTNDEITLVAKKLGRVLRIAEEDINDSVVNILNVKKDQWATTYAKYIDNATLATTAAIGTGVPFTSVYKAVTTADSATGYTANANRLQTAGAVTYDDLNDVLALAEASASYDPSGLVVIASPAFRQVLRGIKDSTGSPVFVQGLAGTPDTLFGYPLKWSVGARTSATATATPAGNPLLIVGPSDNLVLGIRSNPESVVIDGRDGASALTDETLLKMRARRAFAAVYPDSFGVLEVTAS